MGRCRHDGPRRGGVEGSSAGSLLGSRMLELCLGREKAGGTARYFYALNTYGAILLQNKQILELFLIFSFLANSSLSIC